MSNTFENDYYKFRSDLDEDELTDMGRALESIIVHKHEIIVYKNKIGKITMSDKYKSEGFEFRKCIVTVKGLFVTMFNKKTNVMKSFGLSDIITVNKSGWQFK